MVTFLNSIDAAINNYCNLKLLYDTIPGIVTTKFDKRRSLLSIGTGSIDFIW